ncbi:hypothetical protein GWE18_40135 [Bradyrhizobium sp. CSA112]|nr:hypothetical protein [Bradyrhizobium sp. CSA112]
MGTRRAGRGSGNSRNATSSKALLTDDGAIEMPRDRAGTFEPVIVAKGTASTASTRRSSASMGGA